METKTLHSLIDKYFDGSATLSEEHQLREALLQLTAEQIGADRKAQEALAVMSFAMSTPAAEPVVKTSGRRHTVGHLRLVASVAAAVMILFSLVSVFLGDNLMPECHCFASVNGERVEDVSVAFSMMAEQLQAAGDASADVDSQLEECFLEIADNSRNL